MPTPEMASWSSLHVLAEVSLASAKDAGQMRQVCNLQVTLCDVDLPAFFSDQKLYIQAPLRHVLEACYKAISESFSNLEVGVSAAGGRPFPLDGDGRPIYGSRLVIESLVRNSREQ